MDDILKQNLVKDFGLELLSADEQEDALLTMGRLLFQAIILRVLEDMNDEEKDEFERLLDEKSEDSDAVYNYLRSKVENFDDLVKNEIAVLKEDAMEFMGRR